MAKTEAEKEIKSLIGNWEADVRSCDVTRIMRHYADNIRSFDAIGPLRLDGIDAYRKHWSNCMAHCQAPMTFDISSLEVVADDDIGFAHFLVFCGGTDPQGNRHEMWSRATGCYRRIGGEWKIVHEHFSVPFDPETGKTNFDLKP